MRKKLWEKIRVDKKIIEHFIDGKSANQIEILKIVVDGRLRSGDLLLC